MKNQWSDGRIGQISGAVTTIISSIPGEDYKREGLRQTPLRVAKAYEELFSGYSMDPEKVMTTFDGESYDEMVVVKGIEFVSFCEHHMLPFIGVANIGYVPNGRVLGVSKLVRVLEIYTRRLQIQERICQQVTQAIDKHLKPQGSACVLEAKHFCMVCRGVRKQGSTMVTSSLTGVFKTNPETREEFLDLIR